MANYNSFPIRIPYTHFGNGAVDNVGKVAKEFGVKKALLVTDEGIVQSGLLDKVKQPLEGKTTVGKGRYRSRGLCWS